PWRSVCAPGQMAFSFYRRPALEWRRIMWFSSWLRNRTRSSSDGRGRPYGPPRKRATFRPILEALEDRWLPSTLTVLNTNDSGPDSLRAEIAAANPGDTIVFATSVQSITLFSGELLLDKSLTIQGLGAGQLAVSGDSLSRVFDVQAGATVSLSGLTI